MYSGCRDRDHLVVGFITTYAIGAYHHLRCEFESHSQVRCTWYNIIW